MNNKNKQARSGARELLDQPGPGSKSAKPISEEELRRSIAGLFPDPPEMPGWRWDRGRDSNAS